MSSDARNVESQISPEAADVIRRRRRKLWSGSRREHREFAEELTQGAAYASITMVTGPSFTSSSSIFAPKTPVSTGTPSARSSLQKRS